MKRRDVCKVVFFTSIGWFILDLVLILYLIDCNSFRQSQGGQQPRWQQAQKYAGSVRKPKARQAEQNPEDSRVSGILAKLMNGLFTGTGGPGEMGRPVIIEERYKEEMEEKFKINQFNIMASDRISLNRSIPDVRAPECLNKKYSENLPSASIIIVFHNEAWSTLLRTLHSVVNRSPTHLISEIVLVDDLSDRDYLKEPLDVYIKRFESQVPVKIIHLPERSGLIQARLHGSEVAVGPVLLFLDAHVEVVDGWLPPLLDRILHDRKRVVAPIIDVISDETFEFVTASDTTWGGFNWHLNFRWFPVPPREMERRNNDRSEPIQTPTIAGGLFAIDKGYFYEIGTYDEGMQVWGGENLEISFRVWMCGGSLEIVTCSRVGHVFRKQTPYTFPGGTVTVIHRNQARTVEAWMDQYKEFFYKTIPDAKRVERGSLESRKALRKRLGCKNFRWYLENIYPEAPVPLDFHSIGFIKNANDLCIDTLGRSEGQQVGLGACHGMGGNQVWSYTGTGAIHSDELCLAPSGSFNSKVKLENCNPEHEGQKWHYNSKDKHFKSVPTGHCLSANGESLEIRQCISNDVKQFWLLEDYRKEI